jgi:poly(3-hydroxybutyrate) depolymerase
MAILRKRLSLRVLCSVVVMACSVLRGANAADSDTAGSGGGDAGSDGGGGATDAGSPYPSGATDVSLDWGGSRRFRVYVPASLGSAAPRAVVGRVISAEATRDAYLARNGLSSTYTSTETVEVDAADPGTAERFVYAGAAPVEWWRLNGAGHPPPSRSVLVATTSASGAQNRDIEFAEVAWAFFAARLGD